MTGAAAPGRLRVVIDARLRDGEPGGVQQIVVGLACGLSRMSDESGDEYLFATWKGASGWLKPYVGGSARIVEISASRLRAVGRGVRKAVAATGLLGTLPSSPMQVVRHDSSIEALQAGVIHFPMQRAFLTRTPTLYQPHDLQHRHLPEFFTPGVRAARDRAYRAYCTQASAVVMMSEWGRDDIVCEYGLPPGKVCVVPWAPLLPEYPAATNGAVEDVRRRYALPRQFAYFPAHTFPHKNHLGLLDALAWLRDRAILEIPLVCTGRCDQFYSVIRKRVCERHLDRQVRFLGFVSPKDVSALYAACRALVFPSLFEGWGLPLCEAFWAGVPAVCSNVTCLPRQADGAAVLVDPRDRITIARALEQVWVDAELRTRMIGRGREVARQWSWDRTAEMFRAHYRRVAGRPLSPRELDLIESAQAC